jgi:thiol-disulfide isomerase/thioredoxin
MKFRSQQTSTSFAVHDQIQSVSLNPQRHGTDFDDELIERLMTVPRSMKQDPPTHLFVSITGDYLRGRLISFDGETVTAEIRLEVIQIPASQISKIIWLHDREWESNAADPEKADSEDQAEKPFRVHVISSGERGLTFKPVRYEQGELNGQSDLLGACSVKIADVNQILFGRDIAARVREFRQDPWTLSLAQYPRVYLESGDDATAPTGPMSPMVGEPAFDFGLNSLAGEGFRLRTQRDRVVVLDFWASWCGPCIQTMPLVEEVVDEVGQERVHLVAVNIQESRERVQAAVDRLGLNATVLLDTDGQVAAAYEANAIPQTVIIDRQGVVRYVFVGGGNRFVGQFRAALNEVLAGEVSSGSND